MNNIDKIKAEEGKSGGIDIKILSELNLNIDRDEAFNLFYDLANILDYEVRSKW